MSRPFQQGRRFWLIGSALLGLTASAIAQKAVEKPLKLQIIGGVIATDQQLIKVTQGDLLRWRVSSNQAGELHLHAYRLSVKLQAGEEKSIAFSAFATGRFRLEWHAEKNPAADQHQALAMLEVRPR